MIHVSALDEDPVWHAGMESRGCAVRADIPKKRIAKDCLLTLAKSRLALGSPGCSVVWLFGCLFVTMPKMAEYTEISC